ncbi:MAG: DUF2061 domain-containing protein [Haloferacaceae archaeon]
MGTTTLGDRVETATPRQSRARALLKALIYRVLMVAVTVVAAYAFTEDPAAAINIGVAANAIKTVTYYVYERAWDRVGWGVN